MTAGEAIDAPEAADRQPAQAPATEPALLANPADPSSVWSLFVSCPAGIEPILATELRGLGSRSVGETRFGVRTEGDWSDICRIVLWSRVANRVLLPLARFPLETAESLYAGAYAIDWPAWFDADQTLAVQVAGSSPTVTHTHFAALKAKDGIVDRFRDHCGERPSINADAPDIAVHLHLERDRATLSLELSGGSLHRRGYRQRGHQAPLKENVAAAILLRAGWPALAAAGAPLLDPLCGSGTLPIEAALIAADIAPGLLSPRFGGAALKSHREEVWEALLEEARARRERGLAASLPRLVGQDLDPVALADARAAAERAGVASLIEWRQRDASASRPDGERTGLIVANPPYGVRLGSEGELVTLYSLLGETLRRHFGGWQLAFFTGKPEFGPRLGLRAHKTLAMKNGALDCKLLLIDIPAPAANAAVTTRTYGEDFANRLRKNLRHRGKWARRSGIGCYRVYDADLPDYAVAVDLYTTEPRSATGPAELHVQVQEYAAPAEIEVARAEARLRTALQVIHEVLQVPASHIHYKLRQAQKGSAQYQRQAETEDRPIIDEQGCRLKVNFTDYLDTGLFLDHRALRRRIQGESSGMRFLNLFCYTGSASVHAAVGGARQTVSVDLSATYLDWAAENLALNGFQADIESGPGTQDENRRHRLVRDDCLEWLAAQTRRRRPPQFDLVLFDPPTFSNSKKMESTWDVQRDHVAAIESVLKLLSPCGRLYFSTNRKRFRFDIDALRGCKVEDITLQTLDLDFPPPPPAHRCWLITASPNPATG